MARRNLSTGVAVALIVMSLVGQCYGMLQVGYYNGKCGKLDVEELIFRVVRAKFMEDHTIVGDVIRLTFHDCFVRGCDASILLDGPKTEKTAEPNLTLDGFSIIDAVKDTVEKFCPGVVSCADVVQLAARSMVFLAGGKWYNVETGRKDGRVSIAQEANDSLPGPNTPVPIAIEVFAKWGLNVEDFVLLLGCHTVGFAHCSSCRGRIYNYRNTGGSDPAMNPSFLPWLKKQCPRNGSSDEEIFLDQSKGSGLKFDNGFYKAIRSGKGILQLDQDMASDPDTKDIVERFAKTQDFMYKFGQAMVKMGRNGALTGNQGEVRKHCRWVN